jgi:peptidylprolyl isomerase
MSRLPTLLACLLLIVFAAACGDDSEDETAAPQETATATESAAPEPEPEGSVDADAISKDLSAKPELSKPEGSPPAELQKTDIVKGKGTAAKPGDTVSVQYVGNSWSTGAQFDASWDRGGEPFEFPLGAGQVIPGWDQGVAGMKRGGRRLLVIPPHLAYGAQSPSPAIAPNETLIFVVDLEKIG